MITAAVVPRTEVAVSLPRREEKRIGNRCTLLSPEREGFYREAYRTAPFAD